MSRRTREEALRAEDQAVRLSARGLTDAEIGRALELSESEARRKRANGLRRLAEARASGDAEIWAQTAAELMEALRTAYRDHDDAPSGSPARVGAMRVVGELLLRLARLRGLDLDRTVLALFHGTDHPAQRRSLDDDRPLLREEEERISEGARQVIEIGLASAPGDIRLPGGSGDEGEER